MKATDINVNGGEMGIVFHGCAGSKIERLGVRGGAGGTTSAGGSYLYGTSVYIHSYGSTIPVELTSIWVHDNNQRSYPDEESFVMGVDSCGDSHVEMKGSILENNTGSGLLARGSSQVDVRNSIDGFVDE